MSNPAVISVTPVEDVFSITWNISLRCNYDCMYCPSELHDSTSRPHDLETMQQAWENIHKQSSTQGLKYKISFTGGEPTSSRAFMPFLEWLRNTAPCELQILLTTNGSATYKYYRQLYNSVDNISFSIHSEHINELKFFDMIINLDDEIKFTMSIASVKLVLDYFDNNKYIIKKIEAKRSINSKNPESKTTEVIISN